jgi:two-component system, chemotaxis family, CheB/CheR fusion protein
MDEHLPSDSPSLSPSVNEPPQPYPVVGVGASAGGLEAFRQFLTHLPMDTGMAFVLIQHLDPAHASQMAEILSKSTRLPVTEVSDGVAISSDHVYIIPPNASMTIAHSDGSAGAEVLRLTPRSEVSGLHLPVDVFFRSLAGTCKDHAIGVVLSGTGSDGSAGLAEIKAAGGITFAQDADSAEYSSMPESAVAGGCVDFVLAPDQIARELARIGQHP